MESIRIFIGSIKCKDGDMRKRNDVIMYLIEKYGYKTYLEIGVGKGSNFRAIECETKHCVDPNYASTYKMTSDKFFKMLDNKKDKRKYDIVFVDGDHSKRAVMRDVNNSLRYLSKGGIILIHDMNPFSERVARKRPKPHIPTWYGDGFKVLMYHRANSPNLFVRCIDTDCGIGVIQPTDTKQQLARIDKYTYEAMDGDRKRTIGLISVDDFKRLF